ncbi:hypothetical protein GMMP15_1040015 [Candidatus Magnetomoraceae bacterium gMMP-15]
MAVLDWHKTFVSKIYATHNNSPLVKKALNKCLALLDERKIGLNVGSGTTILHSSVINLDIAFGPAINCCGRAEYLPFSDNCFSLVISQETIEHVRYPNLAINEMYRVLKDNGILYLQVPFIIGYHPGPTDFWRFTKEGIREMVEQAGFICEEVDIAVGGGTGMYRIAVEFIAVLFSQVFAQLYIPIKGLAALLLFPLKWLDPILSRGNQVDRIAGGYYVIAKKKN